ncbi:translation [Branchiostoma belcheri]|nr:translation [Branchiostoma belcheri]
MDISELSNSTVALPSLPPTSILEFSSFTVEVSNLQSDFVSPMDTFSSTAALSTVVSVSTPVESFVVTSYEFLPSTTIIQETFASLSPSFLTVDVTTVLSLSQDLSSVVTPGLEVFTLETTSISVSAVTAETVSFTDDVTGSLLSTFTQSIDDMSLATTLSVTSVIEEERVTTMSALGLSSTQVMTTSIEALPTVTTLPFLSPASAISSEFITPTFVPTDIDSSILSVSDIALSSSTVFSVSVTDSDTSILEAISSIAPTVSTTLEVSASPSISFQETSSDTPSTTTPLTTDPGTASFSSAIVSTAMEPTTATTEVTSALTNVTTEATTTSNVTTVVTTRAPTQAPTNTTSESASTTLTTTVTFETVFSTEEVTSELANITTTAAMAVTSTANATSVANTTITLTTQKSTSEAPTTSNASTTASSTSKAPTTVQATTLTPTVAVTTTAAVVNRTENVTTQAVTNGTTRAPTTTPTFVTTAIPTTPARPEGPRKVVPAGLTMQLDFNSNYNDRNSVEFTTLAIQVVESLTAVYVGIPGFIEVVIIKFVPGSVVARYAAVFASDQAESDSAIQQQVQTNLQGAINNGTFSGALNVTDSQAVQPIALTTDELELVSTDSSFCSLQCGEGGVCELGEKFPGVVIAECVCQENYCYAGTCQVIVDQGPRCSCPADTLSWYRGDRCEVSLTQAQVIGFAVGCTAAVLVLIILLVVCMAKRARNMLRAQKARRYRYDMGGFVLGNGYNLRQLADTGFFSRTGRYTLPHTDSTVSSRLYTWNPTVKNIPGGDIKIPRAHAAGKVFPKQEQIYAQTIEMRF